MKKIHINIFYLKNTQNGGLVVNQSCDGLFYYTKLFSQKEYPLLPIRKKDKKEKKERRYKKERVIVVESPRPLSKQASKLVQKQTLKPESKSNWLLTIGPPPLPLWHWALK